MTQLSKAAFLTKFNALFADNTTRDISEADLRTLAEDLKDSVPFNLDASLAQLVTVKVTISSAEILALNATPKTLVAAQGASTIIDLVSCQMFLDYNSIAYATNTSLWLSYNASGGDLHTTAVSIASTTADYYVKFDLNAQTAYNSAVRVNTPLVAYVSGGNPTAGNSVIYMYLTYRVITL